MNKEIYDIWFSSLEIKNKVKLKLLKKYSSEEIWNLEFSQLVNEEIDEKEIVNILKNKNLDDYKDILDYMIEKKIKLINIKQTEYPNKLHNIDDKPAFLYVRGNQKILDDDSVGIVGCRLCSNIGKNLARTISKELADKNINIVSGLALGIDKYAHLGALDSNIGKTIAVLGSGVGDNDIYPYQNYKVFERILENGGAIVSEYGIGSKPEKHHFPERNRIISGLSNKIIVVEAKKKSGSLITANWALEQGKDIYAVPRKYSF